MTVLLAQFAACLPPNFFPQWDALQWEMERMTGDDADRIFNQAASNVQLSARAAGKLSRSLRPLRLNLMVAVVAEAVR